MTETTVSGVDHVYVAVTHIDRAERYYDKVMRLLNFRKGTKPIAGEKHRHYFNAVTQYSIRPARKRGNTHDPYSPGLHHLCFRVVSPAEVDAAAAPDCAGWESMRRSRGTIRNMRRITTRHLRRSGWHSAGSSGDAKDARLGPRSLEELTEFEDPLTKAGLV